jgi:hypothetical protein
MFCVPPATGQSCLPGLEDRRADLRVSIQRWFRAAHTLVLPSGKSDAPRMRHTCCIPSGVDDVQQASFSEQILKVGSCKPHHRESLVPLNPYEHFIR